MESKKVIDCGVLTTRANYPLTTRIKEINDYFRTIIKTNEGPKIETIVIEDFHGSPGMRNRTAVNSICKVHGVLQALPRRVVLMSPVMVQGRQAKRNRLRKKRNALSYVKKTYGLQLQKCEHHIADAIIQGEYYFAKAW